MENSLYGIEFLDPDIPVPEFRAMAQKSYMPGLSLQSGMILSIEGAIPDGICNIPVNNGRSVQDNLDFCAIHDNLLLILFSHRP